MLKVSTIPTSVFNHSSCTSLFDHNTHHVQLACAPNNKRRKTTSRVGIPWNIALWWRFCSRLYSCAVSSRKHPRWITSERSGYDHHGSYRPSSPSSC